VLNAASHAANNARLVTLLSALRAHLNTTTIYATQTEAAAQAAATEAQAVGNLEDNIPLGNFVDRTAAANAARATADTAAAIVLQITTDIACTQTEIVNLGLARPTRFTTSSQGSLRQDSRMYREHAAMME
jgi:hypothetical protein